jgi:hypothetical protein
MRRSEPQHSIGGIDAHNAVGWIVRDNTFRKIRSPAGSVAEHAVHFWSGSRDTLVERNLIVDCGSAAIGCAFVEHHGRDAIMPSGIKWQGDSCCGPAQLSGCGSNRRDPLRPYECQILF